MLARLLRDAFGIALGDAGLVEAGATFAELSPAAYTADLVLHAEDVVIVVEAQLGRDEDKRHSWPLYAASAHARERRPTYLVVVTLDRGVAAWARRPIATFQGGAFAPLVLGPDEIPVVRDLGEARASPELAVLSAPVHGRDGELAREVGAAGIVGAEVVARRDEDRGKLLFDAVLHALGAAAREILEAMMRTQGHEYRSELVREWLQQGRLEGREEGRLEGVRDVVRHLCGALAIELTEARRSALEGMDVEALVQLSEHLARERRWPE